MATTRETTVDIEGDEIRITNLTIHNDELAADLADKSVDDRRQWAERAFKIGARTLQLSETSKDLEYVKREFERMQSDLEEELDDTRDELDAHLGDEGKLERALDTYLGDNGELRTHLDDAFGEEGSFVERLDEELGEDGERIQNALDPDVEGTPTYRLKSELRDEIRSIRDEMLKEEGREEVRQRSWQKGETFEDTVGNLLEDIVYQTTHEVRDTGDQEGSLPGRDVGDHVLTLAETGQRIVFESKSEKNYTEPKIRSEMAEAIENRDADYGIFVTESESYVPDKVGYFQEWDNEVLAVALCHDEDDEIDPGFLRIAFNWAKMRALQDHVDSDTSVDPETIRAQVKSVRDAIDRFSDAKRKCSSIQDTAEDVKSLLDEIRDDVTSDLDALNAELSKAG